jgi:hypothetical protein
MLHPLVFAAQTLPIRDRTEDARAEQAIPFWFERTVVDGPGLVTSPWDQLRIFSGDAKLMRIASKSAIGFAISKGLERYKVFLRFLQHYAAACGSRNQFSVASSQFSENPLELLPVPAVSRADTALANY